MFTSLARFVGGFLFTMVSITMADGNQPARPNFVAQPPPLVSADPPDPITVEAKATASRDARMSWWREAKFGMFIHWGLYAALAGSHDGREIDNNGEWIMDRAVIPVADYAAYARKFNPVKFDATAWARTARNAGMKYIVITAKHHDGFAMFASQASKFNIIDASPFQRDPLAELAEACAKEGLRFGVYYSQAMDWHHPGGQTTERGWWDPAQHGPMEKYLGQVAMPQVRELLTRYGKISQIWWDTPRNMTPDAAAEFYKLVRDLQPDILMNDRLGGGFKGDFDTPEQFIPSTGGPAGRDWETCMTMNQTWGFKNQDTDWKSPAELVRKLVDICHKGGNFLLNVGPTAEGEIPAASLASLDAVGRWLNANAEAIYGSTASPMPYLSWGRCTRRDDSLYLHVFDWPDDRELRLPMDVDVRSATMLARPGEPLAFNRADGAITIRLPDRAIDPIATVIKLEISGEPVVAPPPARGKPSRASSGDPSPAFDGTFHRGWEAEAGATNGWLEVDLLEPVAIAAMAFDEPHRGPGQRGQEFRLEAGDGKDWTTVVSGRTVGHGATVQFSPVTARLFRLVITRAKGPAAISEWQLYRPD